MGSEMCIRDSYTALPDWAQTLGMTFSVMLWMPSWGGMINGLMTLSGAWDKLRTDPVLRMMVVAVAFYGMATFEGPMMSIKIVNSLSHYTDWTIGHVHSGAVRDRRSVAAQRIRQARPAAPASHCSKGHIAVAMWQKHNRLGEIAGR